MTDRVGPSLERIADADTTGRARGGAVSIGRGRCNRTEPRFGFPGPLYRGARPRRQRGLRTRRKTRAVPVYGRKQKNDQFQFAGRIEEETR